MTTIAATSAIKVVELIRTQKLFAILRGVERDHIVETARALQRGGVKLLEVTFNHHDPHGIENTLECMKRIGEALSEEICLGAGTVLTAEQAQLAAGAGARFIVSPNVDQDVIRETKNLGMVSLPGALTPTEIVQAHSAGADMVKLFPGGSIGPDYVKAMTGPLKGIPLVVVGGVTLENIHQFLEAGASGVGLGSNLVNSTEANEGNYSGIEEKSKAFVEMIQTFSG